MTAASPLDILSLPLSGRRLIDASAGTGKTYTITGLVLRLLLEQDLTMDRILVVTYTTAATADLKRRIRGRIREALLALDGGSNDPFINELLGRQPDPTQARQRLTLALAGFDEAPVYTIHGFCQRLLMEYALESRARFDQDLVTDQDLLLSQAIADFLRKTLYRASPLFASHAKARLNPESLLKLAVKILTCPETRVIPAAEDFDEASLRDLEGDFHQSFAGLRAAWPGARPEIAAILRGDAVNHVTYPLKSIPGYLAALDILLAGSATVEVDAKFEKFASSKVAAAAKKGNGLVDHPFFTACERHVVLAAELRGHYEAAILALLFRFTRTIEADCRVRKERVNAITFDDLPRQVLAGLLGEGGDRLATAVRDRYPAALIDEFQDTDPVQYRIFSLIHGQGPGLLCLIGDPKQSIYSFRGADVFAYLKATAQARSRYTLDTNWRSTPGLVAAVNTLFGGRINPFILGGIDFQAAKPMDRPKPPLQVAGEEAAPFILWLTTRPAGRQAKFMPKEEARSLILRAVADEIVRLLTLAAVGQALIDGAPLASHDFAILVRTNHEGRLAQKLLAERGVVSLLEGTESVFVCREARDLERLLLAVAEPANERLLKAALATSLIGLSGEAFHGLSEDDTAFETYLFAFRRYREHWLDHGFIRMFTELLRELAVRPRLLALPDGERRLTNLLQLGELLQQAVHEQQLTMAGVLQFLAERLAGRDLGQEEYQMRLERQRDCVRIVTIHRAKGLEYPVVFCPFGWEGPRTGERAAGGPPAVGFHDPDQDDRPLLDLGSAERPAHLLLAKQEELAENVRLLYVAVTRAVRRCYLVWGALGNAETSALARLLHGPDDQAMASFKRMSDEAIRQDLMRLVRACPAGVVLRDLPGTATGGRLAGPMVEIGLACPDFPGPIGPGFRIASFSSLIHGRRSEDLPDHDAGGLAGPALGLATEGDSAGPARVEEDSILAFPAGAGPGTFMHDLLEHLDFTQPIKGVQDQLIRDKLLAHGFAARWLPAVRTMLDEVVAVPLSRDDPGFCLATITKAERVNEMEFYFPLAALTMDELATLGKKHGHAGLTDLGPTLAGHAGLQGFMKGFIDCVIGLQGRYYVIDWKSNLLGASPDDYRPERLRQTMRAELYTLQYLIYTVALDRYLATRLPDYSYELHFGGIYYIFLRGVNRAWGQESGIFHDRPSAGLIHDLSRLLIPASVASV